MLTSTMNTVNNVPQITKSHETPKRHEIDVDIHKNNVDLEIWVILLIAYLEFFLCLLVLMY